jgi:hypothetical protein
MSGAMREAYAVATAGQGDSGVGEADPHVDASSDDPNANVPTVVIGLWVAAAIGFGAYCAAVYAPHLLAWLR